MSKKPKISVVIPAYNEEKYIRHLFSGLSTQTMKDFEMILVDSNSSDKTREIARKYGKVVIEPRRGIGLARNTGVRHAKGEIIFFTNADTKPTKNLLKIYADAFAKNPKLVAATGPMIPLEETTRFIRFGYKFASVYLAKFIFAIGAPGISGSNFAVRRFAFEKARGFDESLETYEDMDLVNRLKKLGTIEYINNAVTATSTRRIVKWGVLKYIAFNASNVLKYNMLHKSKGNYDPVR